MQRPRAQLPPTLNEPSMNLRMSARTRGRWSPIPLTLLITRWPGCPRKSHPISSLPRPPTALQAKHIEKVVNIWVIRELQAISFLPSPPPTVSPSSTIIPAKKALVKLVSRPSYPHHPLYCSQSRPLSSNIANPVPMPRCHWHKDIHDVPKVNEDSRMPGESPTPACHAQWSQIHHPAIFPL